MKIKLIIVFIIWSSWAWLVLRMTEIPYDPFLITTSSGIVEDASCEIRRSNTALMLSVRMSETDEVSKRILSLPTAKMCGQQLLARLNGKKILLTDYRNVNLGLALDDEVIIKVEDNIWMVENTSAAVYFTLFFAVLASAATLLSGSRKRA